MCRRLPASAAESDPVCAENPSKCENRFLPESERGCRSWRFSDRDVVLREIELVGGDGVSLAEKLQVTNPKINIIYVMVCNEYEWAKEVLRLRPKGYLSEPYTEHQMLAELQQFRYPVKTDPLYAV